MSRPRLSTKGRAGALDPDDQGDPVADASHLVAVAGTEPQGPPALGGQSQTALGVGADDAPRPAWRIRIGAEVGQLTKGGTVPGVKHPPRIRGTVRRRRARYFKTVVLGI